MARSDLLISLIKAGASGDQTLLRKTVEALIAEERSKKHDVLADRLTQYLGTVNGQATNGTYSGKSSPAYDLSFEKVPQRQLSDLLLPAEVHSSVKELIEEHQRVQLLRSHGLEPRHRILLVGEPGNGKTSLSEAIAYELAVPFIVARYDALIGSYLGETASRLRKLFDHVRTRACVLFFDEFETLGKERGDTQETGEIKRVVSSLLLQIDDLPSHVVVVTATNHSELLDKAVWRRFQLRCNLPRPTLEDTQAFLGRGMKLMNLGVEARHAELAEKLLGASYSELEDFLSDVGRRYVLSLPEADLKKVIATRLAEWQKRVRPNKKKSTSK